MAERFRRGAAAQPVYMDSNGTTQPIVLDNDGVDALGATGTVTQTGGNSGAVTLNRGHGRIAMAAALNATTSAEFQLNNSLITATSVVLVNVQAATSTAAASRDPFTACVRSVTAGSCFILVRNNDAADSNDHPNVVHFMVLN